jgi:biotin-[acetyl-CoA-carboxylase] ligase BirA-like protein
MERTHYLGIAAAGAGVAAAWRVCGSPGRAPTAAGTPAIAGAAAEAPPEAQPDAGLEPVFLVGDAMARKSFLEAATATGAMVDGFVQGRAPPHLRVATGRPTAAGDVDDEELALVPCDAPVSDTFDASAYFADLKPQYPCRALLYANIIGSTQTLLEQHPKLCFAQGSGLVCTARTQRKGRGRRTNQWESPPGCLLFSVGWKHADAKTVVFMQYLFGLALVDSIRLRPGYEDLDLRLKWPNDIYHGADTKLGGVLVSSSFADGCFNLVIGCGFNVSNSKPTLCLDEVIDRHNATNGSSTPLPKIRMESVLAGALSQFSEDYALLEKTGSFKPFLERYYRRWIHSGQSVDVVAEDGTKRSVVIAGVTDGGYLHGETASGGIPVELEPDGNTFDMMRGLIQRKL